ncbi:MAG: DUF2147 domain-containing protein [bacterium]
MIAIGLPMKTLHLSIILLIVATAIAAYVFTSAENEADGVIGLYWTPAKDGKVEIFKKDNKYFGKLILSGKSSDDKDEHNPDPKLRDRPLNGIVFLTNFEYSEKESKWINGKVYGADNGKSYRAFMKLKNGNLLLRGYIGISLIGRTETFERIK